MPKPNLFTYATSELSQDAFLAWLLAWADQEHADADAELHRLGQSLAVALFAAAGVTPPEHIGRVKVTRQYHSIDIVAEIDDTHVIAIEDKVDTAQHSDQLDRYREVLNTERGGLQHALLYLKVGDQSCYQEVRDSGWSTFGRADLLRVLEGSAGRTENAILVDFLAHLQRIECDVQSYRSIALDPSKPGDSWSARAWRGFFMALREALGDGNWAYVPNASGGFMGFWWSATSIDGGEIYLQLQDGELVAKVSVEDAAARGAVRDLWSARLVRHSHSGRFRRPSRLGLGRWMTVASGGEYRQVGADGVLDFPRTVDHLRNATAELVELARKGDR